jgi:FMN phosphatase YigB (HAD superfamily)
MIRAYLFDLDDTLLPYDVPRDESLQALLASLAAHFSQWIDPDHFIPAFMKGVQAMDENRGGSLTNLEVFTGAFSTLVDFPADRCEQAVVDFYRTEANKLRYRVRPSSYARAIMDWLFKNDAEVAIATGFQAPVIAAELRLGWAGIPVTDYRYSFIATWDNMHASKPHLQYYQEVLDHIAADATQCLFVGDDWDNEIVPATNLGIRSFWLVTAERECPEELELLSGHGQLRQLYEWITALKMPQ